MEQMFAANRRQFLKGSVAASLVVSFNLPMPKCAAAALASEFAPNAFLRIAPHNTITVISKHIEFGQGPYTGIATILADELDADWSQIRVESAPADHEKYANLSFGSVQGTGGSSAEANSWEQLRNAGAEARARLVAAPPGSGTSMPSASPSRRASSDIPRAMRRRSASWPAWHRRSRSKDSRSQRTRVIGA
jgi:isoquinoline 1-oxidoreductase subunit beta